MVQWRQVRRWIEERQMIRKVFKTSEDRLKEVQLYELVALEIENGQQVMGLWAQALSEAGADEKRAKALYIKLRVGMMQDQLEEKAREARNARKRARKERKQREIEGKEPNTRRRDGNILVVSLWIFVFLVILGIHFSK